MYIRILGAGFSFVACIMAASSYYLAKRGQCAVMESLRFMLVLLRSELSSSAPEMSLLLERAAQILEPPAKDFLLCLLDGMDRLGEQSFDRLWRETADLYFNLPDERCHEAVCRLGNILGRYELEQQLLELDNVIALVSHKAEELTDALKTEKKLAYGLGSALGAMLITVLM